MREHAEWKGLIGHKVHLVLDDGSELLGTLVNVTRASAWINEGDDDHFVPIRLILRIEAL